MHTILYVSATGLVGGAERSLIELVRALDRERFRPCAALPGPGPLSDELREAGAEVVHVPEVRIRRTRNPLRLARMGIGWLRAVRGVARAARRTDADLIHSNNTVAHLIGAPAGGLTRLPVVWHVRDLHRLRVLPHLLRPMTDAVVSVSRAVDEGLPLRAGSALARHVVPNGIDADAFERLARPGALRAELGLSADALLLLMVGQMAPWKGHETFLRALARLQERRTDVTAVVAGSDLFGHGSGYAGSLRDLARDVGLGEAVRFLGQRDDVPTLVADCDVLVIPSRAEPFGRVALEAMAIGRPVVGTNAGGLPEVVEDGRTGLLVAVDDPGALAAALARLADDAELRRAMGQAGRLRVRERFASEGIARAIEEVYAQVIARRARR